LDAPRLQRVPGQDLIGANQAGKLNQKKELIKMKKTIVLTALVFFLLTPLFAQESRAKGDRLYISPKLFAGNLTYVGGFLGKHLDTVLVGGAALGIMFPSAARVEVEYIKYGTFSASGYVQGVPIKAEGEVETYSMLLNLFYPIITTKHANILIGGGVGLSKLRSTIKIPSLGYSDGADDDNFTWNVGAIGELIATENISFDLGFRYFNLDGEDYNYYSLNPYAAVVLKF
jgi:opacity protein-like surface antigen